MMVGESVNKKNGKTYRYYKCHNTKTGHTCDVHSVPKEYLEDAVLSDIEDIVNDTDLMEQIIMEAYKSQDKETPLMKSLNIDLKETQKKLNNIISAFENGFGNDELNTRLNELTARKDELIKAINDETINNPYLEYDEVVALFQRFLSLDIEKLMDRQTLIDAFIDKIVYYDDDTFDVYFTTKGVKRRHKKKKDDSGTNNNQGGSTNGSNTTPNGSP